jgi:DNA-binding GntR family transcriptional regulator
VLDLHTRPVLLQDNAYAALKELIVTGVLRPGAAFSERQMADRLGMSTTPVRAAIRRLASEDFVVISSQRGIFVKTMTVKEMNDLYEYRFALEAQVVLELSKRPDLTKFKALDENLRGQMATAKSGDVAGHIDLDVNFHMMLCQIHGNQMIVEAMGRIQDRLNQIAACVTQDENELTSDNAREHRDLLNLIRKGDGKDAVAMLAAHLDYAREGSPCDPAKPQRQHSRSRRRICAS